LSWKEFRGIVALMSEHLAESGVLGSETTPSRAFHYSKSPWEQLLDGVDYLWGVDVTDGGAEDDISFGAYMMNRGFTRQQLKDVIRRPLVIYRDEYGRTRERNMLELSSGMNYSEAENALLQVVRTLDLRTG